MLDYNILNKKPDITVVKNGEYVTYKDLSTPIYKGNFSEGGRIVRVEIEYVARPDLISLAVYGNDAYADVICKINGISNPFELNEGMYLYVPDMDVINKALTGKISVSDVLDEFKTLNTNNAETIKANNSKSTYTSKSAKSKNNSSETIDKKRKNLQKYKNERRTPGDQTVTDSNYIIDRTLGIVIY